MKRRVVIPLIAATLICYGLPPALADYTLVLKNGRRITAKSYREEGSMIKVPGLGGEFGIEKSQIEAIEKDGKTTQRGFNVTQEQSTPTLPEKQSSPVKPAIAPSDAANKPQHEESLEERRAKEEKQYLERISEITERLKQLRARYAAETTGNTGSDPAFFTSEEAFRAHQEDLLSRLRDAQYRAQGLPIGQAATSPPFSLDPPPAYTPKQKQLSELRSQISQVEAERDAIIAEMKQKGFDTSSIFLD